MYTLTPAQTHHFPSSYPGNSTYVLDIVRTPSSRLAAISSDQRLTLLDPTSLTALASLPTDHGNLTQLRVFGGEEEVVCTAGENGTVAVWDLRAGKKVAQFTASQASILSMACSPQQQTITIGTELHSHQASIHIWDIRTTPSPKQSYHDLHSDDITTLSHHPLTPSLLLSGSTDGLVSIHDTTITDEDEVTVQTLNLDASIHRAAFLAPSIVAALSHDERFALYDVAEEKESGDVLVDFGDLREGTGCRYVADVVPKADGSGAIVGAGAQVEQMFELMFLTQKGESWTLDRENSVGLPGAHGEEIVRSFCFFDQEQVVFTAGEDGNIKAWRPGH